MVIVHLKHTEAKYAVGFWRCQAVQDPSLKTFDSLKELANLSPALHSLGNYGFGHDIL